MKTNNIFKILAPICVLLSICMQNMASAQTYYNPKIGLHISAIDGKFKDSVSLNSRVGWQIGLDIRKGSGIFFLNPGLHYKVTGIDLQKKVNTSGSIKDLTGQSTIQTLDLPINGGLFLTGKDQALLRIFVHGGITPSYIVGIKSVDKFDLKPTEFNRFQLGVNAGVGIDLLFLNVGLNYEYYLMDYFKNQPGKNRTISLNLGFVF